MVKPLPESYWQRLELKTEKGDKYISLLSPSASQNSGSTVASISQAWQGGRGQWKQVVCRLPALAS